MFFQQFWNCKKLGDISRLMVFTCSTSVHWFQRYSLLNFGVFSPPHLQRTFVNTICNTKVNKLFCVRCSFYPRSVFLSLYNVLVIAILVLFLAHIVHSLL